MKLIYIVGLEHSGTTVTDKYIGQQLNALSLGEIKGFFDVDHMENYLRTWGDYPDARMCSCQSEWQDCAFWGELYPLAGCNSNETLLAKYSALVKYVESKYGKDTVIVDSSKSLDNLKQLKSNADQVGLCADDIAIVYCVKDARSFVMSNILKHNNRATMKARWQSLNYWYGANSVIYQYLESDEVDNYHLSLYEDFCTNPKRLIKDLNSSGIGLNDVMKSKNESHIAMGNKDFINQNTFEINYDDRWRKDKWIRSFFTVHSKVRKLNSIFSQRVSIPN